MVDPYNRLMENIHVDFVGDKVLCQGTPTAILLGLMIGWNARRSCRSWYSPSNRKAHIRFEIKGSVERLGEKALRRKRLPAGGEAGMIPTQNSNGLPNRRWSQVGRFAGHPVDELGFVGPNYWKEWNAASLYPESFRYDPAAYTGSFGGLTGASDPRVTVFGPNPMNTGKKGRRRGQTKTARRKLRKNKVGKATKDRNKKWNKGMAALVREMREDADWRAKCPSCRICVEGPEGERMWACKPGDPHTNGAQVEILNGIIRRGFRGGEDHCVTWWSLRRGDRFALRGVDEAGEYYPDRGWPAQATYPCPCETCDGEDVAPLHAGWKVTLHADGAQVVRYLPWNVEEISPREFGLSTEGVSLYLDGVEVDKWDSQWVSWEVIFRHDSKPAPAPIEVVADPRDEDWTATSPTTRWTEVGESLRSQSDHTRSRQSRAKAILRRQRRTHPRVAGCHA
jgi:hypothetical protein